MTAAAIRETAVVQEPIDCHSFRKLAALVHAEAGIVLLPEKEQLVRSRLASRVRTLGLRDHAAYVARLGADAAERAVAVDALTTNHTMFVREAHHFTYVVKEVWPALKRRLDGGGRVRIWSAGCSSGEEPYTMAMMLLGEDPGAARRLRGQDVRILATDVSTEALRLARAGVYTARAASAVPPALRGLWMRDAGGGSEVVPEVRALVCCRPLNLIEPWPMQGTFDVILCRNVMIYFDEATKIALQARMAQRLSAGGLLCLGHAERLDGPANDLLQPIGQTMYRRVPA